MIGFGNFGKKRYMEITTLADERLLRIDPSGEGFFDKVLGYVSENEQIQAFVEAVKEVQEAELSPFWKPVLDPGLDGEKVIFKKGEKPAVERSFDWWKAKVQEMPAVEGKKWALGTEYQYYAFLVYLINQLVEKCGWRTYDVMKAVVIDSKEFGNYYNSKNSQHVLEKTGSREICGCYDLINTYKVLRCTNEEDGGFWIASSDFTCYSYHCTLANLSHTCDVDCILCYGVGWPVLE